MSTSMRVRVAADVRAGLEHRDVVLGDAAATAATMPEMPEPMIAMRMQTRM